MKKEFDAVEMVRKIRDDLYEQTKAMSAAELVEFFRRHGASAKVKLSRVGPSHELGGARRPDPLPGRRAAR
jgi:hypothetical protein